MLDWFDIWASTKSDSYFIIINLCFLTHHIHVICVNMSHRKVGVTSKQTIADARTISSSSSYACCIHLAMKFELCNWKLSLLRWWPTLLLFLFVDFFFSFCFVLFSITFIKCRDSASIYEQCNKLRKLQILSNFMRW